MLSYVVHTVTFIFALILSPLKVASCASPYRILVLTHENLVVIRYTPGFLQKPCILPIEYTATFHVISMTRVYFPANS
jgi:hypothetical protein